MATVTPEDPRLKIALDQFFSENSNITDRTGDRIFGISRSDKGHPNVVEQIPALVFTVFGGDTPRSHNGPAGLARTRTQVDIFAANDDDLIALWTEIRQTLEEHNGPMGSQAQLQVYGCLRLDWQDNDEEGADEYRTRSEWAIWHEEVL